MGNLVSDAMLDRAGEQGVTIAIQNGGGLRASIDAGEITMGEVLTVLPFSNTMATFQLSGADIVASLENGLSQIEDGAGRFPQVAEPAPEAPAATEAPAAAPEAPAAMEAPAMEAPAMEAPAMEAPAMEAPAMEAPAMEAPAMAPEAPAATTP